MVDLRRERIGVVFVRVEDIEIGRLERIARAGGRVGDRRHDAVKRADATLRNDVAGKGRTNSLSVGRERIENGRLHRVVIQYLAEISGEQLWRWDIIVVAW